MGVDGDVSMDASPAPPAPGTEAVASDSAEASSSATHTAGAAKDRRPDYHLFHALSSTRAALDSLEETARTPAIVPSPRDELRALEARILNSGGAANGDTRKAGGARSAVGSASGTTSMPPPVRGWDDSSLSNTPNRPLASVVGGSGMTPRGMGSTPGLSPSMRVG